MTRLFAVVAIAFALLFSGAAKADNFENYKAAKDTAWTEYAKAKDRAWSTYSAARDEGFKAYYTLEKAAILKLRGADYENYLQWLDAEKTDDFEKIRELERTVPALAEYKKTHAAEYAKYEEATRKAHVQYEKDTRAAHKAYEQAVQTAYAAYQGKQ